MKILTISSITITLMLLVFAIGFQLGRSEGFKTGSEWSLVQAGILAREAGVFMPVYMNNGKLRVVIKQPRNLYKRAWQLADQHDDARGSLKTTNLNTLPDQAEPKEVAHAEEL